MEHLICDDDGMPIDATIEIAENSIVLQSRWGAKGSPKATNTDYSNGLRLLLRRFRNQNERFVEAFVDSKGVVQSLSKEDRLILSNEEMDKTVNECMRPACLPLTHIPTSISNA